jgi:hypothetical protein
VSWDCRNKEEIWNWTCDEAGFRFADRNNGLHDNLVAIEVFAVFYRATASRLVSMNVR